MAKGGIDKEVLKKNQFWIVLGAFAVLWMVAFVMVKVSASDEKQKAWKTAKDAIDGAWTQGPKTQAYQVPWNEHGTKFRTHKDVIWGVAWRNQEAMYTWPDSMPVPIRPKYIDDSFGPPGDTRADLNNRGAFRTDWYNEQLQDLKKANLAAPAEFAGGSVFNVIFPQTWHPTESPTREEIWLAQEDFWVRRELLFTVVAALDAVQIFKEVTPGIEKRAEAIKEKKPLPPLPNKRIYRNANWELTLLLEPREPGSKVLVISDKSTIKNINAAERTLMLAHPKTNKGLPFRVHQNNASAEFNIAGEPLPFGAEIAFKQKINTPSVELAKEFGVEQVLAWEISPVRRIDALQLAWHSHRTVTAGFKVYEDLKKLDPEPEVPADAGGTGTGPGGVGGSGGATGGPPKGMGMGMGMGEGTGMGMGGARGSGDATRVNGIGRERYMHITPQCRHLPVALKLLIDQAHIHDVLTAVANSRLRIQVTQVSLHHDPASGQQAGFGAPGTGGPGSGGPAAGGPAAGGGRGSPAPPMASGAGGGRGGVMGMGGAPRPGGGRGGMGSFPGRPFMPGMGGGRGTGEEGGMGMPGPGGVGGPAEGVSTFQDTAKLIEVSIYGIASLYERFPPRPKQGDAPSTPSTPSTPTK